MIGEASSKKDAFSAQQEKQVINQDHEGEECGGTGVIWRCGVNDRNAVLALYFNDLIDEKFLRSEVSKKTVQELPMFVGSDLRDDDEEASSPGRFRRSVRAS